MMEGYRIACRCALTAALALATAAVQAQYDGGTNDRASRAEAQQAIPFAHMQPAAVAKVQPIVASPSIYRRLPSRTIACDPEMHVFLLRNPDVVVNIWQLMGISKVQVQEVAAHRYTASDDAGTVADVEIVFGTPDLHVVYAEGTYEGPIFKQKLKGRCVLLLRSKYGRDAAGRIVVTNVLDTFVQVDGVGLDLVARTLQPVLGQTADHNFAECNEFVARVSQAAEINGVAVQRLSGRLDAISGMKRDEFAAVAGNVNRRATQRVGRAQGATIIPIGGAKLTEGQILPVKAGG